MALVFQFMLTIFVNCISGKSIRIRNSGFETDYYPVSDNTYNYVWQPTGWNRYDPLNVGDIYTMGVVNPTGGTSIKDTVFYDSVPEGIQCIFIDQWVNNNTNEGELGIYQTLLGNEVTVGTTYTLSAWITNGKTNTWSHHGVTYLQQGFGGYRVQLMADNDILTEDDNTLSIVSGYWTQSIVTYTVSSGPHIGKRLGIRLINKNSADYIEDTDTGLEVYFDGIELQQQMEISNDDHINASSTIITVSLVLLLYTMAVVIIYLIHKKKQLHEQIVQIVEQYDDSVEEAEAEADQNMDHHDSEGVTDAHYSKGTQVKDMNTKGRVMDSLYDNLRKETSSYKEQEPSDGEEVEMVGERD